VIVEGASYRTDAAVTKTRKTRVSFPMVTTTEGAPDAGRDESCTPSRDGLTPWTKAAIDRSCPMLVFGAVKTGMDRMNWAAPKG
jgi:hypothetical protein